MSVAAYPFTAVVGMDDMATALLLATVSPAIGGVLVRGEKGTAKSTMVRALAKVLPPLGVVPGCRFSCDPAAPSSTCPDLGTHTDHLTIRPTRLVELPVGATEDRVLGSLQLDALLADNAVKFEPGLLAQAHRGVLYVDEVNLLPDHVVDTLLDAAAMGVARIERDNVSVTHDASFVLVGTMNPEEGDLRPQLLDRFGLTTHVAASRDPHVRAEVMVRRLRYDANPDAFAEQFRDAEAEVTRRVETARRSLASVSLPPTMVQAIAAICADFDVDGMRGDIVTARAAVAHAAWSGRSAVTGADVRVAARLALPHRRRRNPFDTAESAHQELERILDVHLGEEQPPPPPPPHGDDASDDTPSSQNSESPAPGEQPPAEWPADPSQEPHAAPQLNHAPPPSGSRYEDLPLTGSTNQGPESETPGGQATERQIGANAPYQARLLTLATVGAGSVGRRSEAVNSVGRSVAAVPLSDHRGSGLAITSTVVRSAERSARDAVQRRVQADDLRRHLRRGKEGNLVLFVVDASGSMGARQRMAEVKAAAVSLLTDAYQRRDTVGVITFARDRATVALSPTSSVDLAHHRLHQLPTGGRTPLAEGLEEASKVVRREHARDPWRRTLVVVLTDGRATHGPRALERARAAARELAHRHCEVVMIDCESPRGITLGLAKDLAHHAGARYLRMSEVAASSLINLVHPAVTHQGAA